MSLADIGATLGNALSNLGAYSGQAAARANLVSDYAQSAQGAFNQASADYANQLALERMEMQYQYNAAQAEAANEFTRDMWERQAAYNTEMWERNVGYQDYAWDKAAKWNEMMYGRQEDFNERQAKINRNWQERMANTAYQRAVADMEAAGLNPILAVTGGGISTGAGSGSQASIGGTSMGAASSSPANVGSAHGVAASGGIITPESASVGNYTGQMEYLSGTLGLISAVIGSVSSAFKNIGTLGDIGQGIGESIAKAFNPNSTEKSNSIINKILDQVDQELLEPADKYGQRGEAARKYYEKQNKQKVKGRPQ